MLRAATSWASCLGGLLLELIKHNVYCCVNIKGNST
nr:MAG TPA_asm: hypothetical protein [Caudoviricetes sp.]